VQGEQKGAVAIEAHAHAAWGFRNVVVLTQGPGAQ